MTSQQRPALEPSLALSWAVRLLRPGGVAPGREAFQLRFLAGASLLALAVGLASLAAAALQAQHASLAAISGFMGLLLAGLVAIRLGAPVEPMAWGLVALVTAFLVAASLTTRALDPSQLSWFLLVPLAARVIDAPHPEAPAAGLVSRPVVSAAVVAAAAAGLVVLGHELGYTLDQPPDPGSGGWALVQVLLFLASAFGLVALHDLAARETAAELRRLRTLLSVCAWCRRILDADGWVHLEQYMARRVRADVSHGICPTCLDRQDHGAS